ncbi:MAG: prepilin-type N-terminal cleavage/methylation domain-containing protein [Verrucomicrobiales bacterium]|nr:prepilin-type N-terminal cleavage/methylation domain-containing protein [Verrucomicrobiales bacterium]
MNRPSSSMSNPAPRAAGFTLLEVLLAITVGAVVLVAINGVFFSALRLRERTTRLIESALPVQRALNLVTRDLASLVPPGTTMSGAFATVPTNSLLPGQVTPDLFTASATLDDLTPWPEVQKVAYLVLPSTNRAHGKQLVRAVTRNLLATVTESPAYEPVLDGVESLTLLYHDGTQWQTTWDSATAATPLPAAIKVELQLEAGSGLSDAEALAQPNASRGPLPPVITTVVPILLDGSTNTTDTASTSASSTGGSSGGSPSGNTGGSGSGSGGNPGGGAAGGPPPGGPGSSL